MHSAIDSISIQPLKFHVWSVLSIMHSQCCLNLPIPRAMPKDFVKAFIYACSLSANNF